MICIQKWVGMILIFGMLSSFFHPHSDTELLLDHHQNCLVCLQMTLMVSVFPTHIAPVFHSDAYAYIKNKGEIPEIQLAVFNQRAPPRFFL